MNDMDIYQRCEKAIEGYAQQTNMMPQKEIQEGISFGVQWADSHKLRNEKAKQFYDLVKDMRTAQICYFKTRSQEWLSKSQQIEGQIDYIIRETEAKIAGQQSINFNQNS